MVAVSGSNQVAANEIDQAAFVERRLLGCLMWSDLHGSDGLDSAAEKLTPADFVVHVHGVIFGICIDLRAANDPVTAVSVYQRLAATKQLAELGTNPALWIADTIDDARNDVYASHYAKGVSEASARRRLKRVAFEILKRVEGEGGRAAADTLADCEQLLFDIGGTAERGVGPTQAPELVRDAMQRIDDLANGEGIRGIATGFADLDELLGGLKPGQMVVVGARPGVGKTALALGINAYASANGVGSLLFSMEMARAEIMERMLAMRSGVPLRAIQAGSGLTGEQAEQVERVASKLRNQSFEIDDTPSLTVARIASTVRNAVRRRGVGLVTVDYLQLLQPENPKDNRTQQVGADARRLKLMARSCGVPVVVLCQLNRESEARPGGKPKLSDLRESGEIEQHADAVVLLHSHPDQSEESPVWLTDALVRKNRGGPIGDVTLAYRRAITRFENSQR